MKYLHLVVNADSWVASSVQTPDSSVYT